MATFTKLPISSQTGNADRGLRLQATSSPGTTIHATGTSASVIDELWLWLFNSDTVSRIVTLQLGGTTSPDDDLVITIPPRCGRFLVLEGQPFTGTGSVATTIKGYADAADVVIVHGFVNRIS